MQVMLGVSLRARWDATLVPLIGKTGWGTTEREKGRERGRGMQCFMKKEDKSLLDVENIETAGERCRPLLLSELTNTIELFIVCVHRNEAHFTYI